MKFCKLRVIFQSNNRLKNYFRLKDFVPETMEITTKGMTTTKNPLINLMTPIYFTNYQKGQLVDFLKKYPCIIYMKNVLNVNFKSLHSNKIKSVSTLTLKFSK